MEQLSDIVKRIQGINVDTLSHDQHAQSDLLQLARKLTVVLEGPVNRATDLVFKVGIRIGCA